jgi:hypothetical protein
MHGPARPRGVPLDGRRLAVFRVLDRELGRVDNERAATFDALMYGFELPGFGCPKGDPPE